MQGECSAYTRLSHVARLEQRNNCDQRISNGGDAMKQWRDTELLNIHSRLSGTGIDSECLMMAETGRASSKPMEDERTIRETFLPLPNHSQTLLFHKACNSKCSSPTCRSCQLPPRTNCSAVCRTLPHIIDGVIPPRTKSNLGKSSAQGGRCVVAMIQSTSMISPSPCMMTSILCFSGPMA